MVSKINTEIVHVYVNCSRIAAFQLTTIMRLNTKSMDSVLLFKEDKFGREVEDGKAVSWKSPDKNYRTMKEGTVIFWRLRTRSFVRISRIKSQIRNHSLTFSINLHTSFLSNFKLQIDDPQLHFYGTFISWNCITLESTTHWYSLFAIIYHRPFCLENTNEWCMYAITFIEHLALNWCIINAIFRYFYVM